ncbi:hypothetical protein GLE_0019 [Lysobacter enzymogenes]|uniref:Uncharacterized protein n=2 Tax=Lysobacter TaxID=68 RepID=A0A0S2DA16_LYSEN|nr:hypothetical protein GLE_0019 [Lysobacter enzymogenes]
MLPRYEAMIELFKEETANDEVGHLLSADQIARLLTATA